MAKISNHITKRMKKVYKEIETLNEKTGEMDIDKVFTFDEEDVRLLCKMIDDAVDKKVETPDVSLFIETFIPRCTTIDLEGHKLEDLKMYLDDHIYKILETLSELMNVEVHNLIDNFDKIMEQTKK